MPLALKQPRVTSQWFRYLLEKYFRIRPNTALDNYIQEILRKPYYDRIVIAQTTSFPQVVEALVNDIDPWVREAAQNNEYWQHLGQFKELLQMSRQEKLAFIQREAMPNLMVFLFYEQDWTVLEAVLNHPSLSIADLNLLKKYLQKRGFGTQDDRYLSLIHQVLDKKHRRLQEIARLRQLQQSGSPINAIHELWLALDFPDDIVQQFAANELTSFPLQKLAEAFHPDTFLSAVRKHPAHRLWQLLDKFQKLLQNRRMRKRLFRQQRTLPSPELFYQFHHQIKACQKALLDQCGRDLTQYSHFLCIVLAHVSSDPELQKIAANILTLEDIFALITERTFPQAIGRKALHYLKRHPHPAVQKQIVQALLVFSELTRKQLQEMEVSINAYMDIIFNSLHFPQIRQIRQTLRTIHEARQLSETYFLHHSVPSQQWQEANRMRGLFRNVEQFYVNQLKSLYRQITKEDWDELQEIHEIISIVLALPATFAESQGYNEALTADEARTQLHKAWLVWRSTLGQYLGRLKELCEILHHKWLEVLPNSIPVPEFQEDFNNALRELEQEHKRQQKCHLTITCRQCQKRACAAERFLKEGEFLIGELLDFRDSEIQGVEKSESKTIKKEEGITVDALPKNL